MVCFRAGTLVIGWGLHTCTDLTLACHENGVHPIIACILVAVIIGNSDANTRSQGTRNALEMSLELRLILSQSRCLFMSISDIEYAASTGMTSSTAYNCRTSQPQRLNTRLVLLARNFLAVRCLNNRSHHPSSLVHVLQRE